MTTLNNSVSAAAYPAIVVLGYGNPHRGDDAIGHKVVSHLEALQMPTVRAFAVTQLIPELSSKLATADCVIFVDACKLANPDVRVTPLIACGSEAGGSVVPASGHSCDPCSLLALTSSVYGRCPQAWWVEVPGSDFTVGSTLSALAEWGITQALREIEKLIAESSKTLTP